MKRSSGILMHISSLPSDYGIGTLGKEARNFVDFLKNAGQTYWQILPIGPTSYGDSPYQSFSVFAGNPYFIDLEELCSKGLLSKENCTSYDWGTNDRKVDYQLLFENRLKILETAFNNITKKEERQLKEFRKEPENASWVEDYALYMAVKERMNLRPWREWEQDIRLRESAAVKKYQKELAERISFYVWTQFTFFAQWKELKCYANKNGVKIIGDIPIYVAEDSADTWAHTELFEYSKDCKPLEVAGCPPDYFSKTGQLWGNPLYKWDKMAKNGYSWWVNRINAMSKLFDLTRIDHFRGFESYYAIPAGSKTAEHGHWKKGPGIDLFEAVRAELGDVKLIAEDLGTLTNKVTALRKKAGYPGMKVLEFAFDSGADNPYLPHNCIKNSVIYTGTHDNNTAQGWLESLSRKEFFRVMSYLNARDSYEIYIDLIRAAWSSVCDLSIAQMQDFLGLGSFARMNIPSTMGGNWAWRMLKEECTDDLAGQIREITILYGRKKINNKKK